MSRRQDEEGQAEVQDAGREGLSTGLDGTSPSPPPSPPHKGGGIASRERFDKFVLVSKDKLDAPAAKPPGFWLLVMGVLYPLAVIGFELATGWCAEMFFDPTPTVWHVALVALVPFGNLAVWVHVRTGRLPPKWVAAANGTAIGVACFYALIFLPLAPLALIAILAYGLGLLPLAPGISLAAAVLLRGKFTEREPKQKFGRALAAAIALGLSGVVLLDVPAAATRLGLAWTLSGSGEDRAKGLALIRAIGDEDLLLRLCYDTAGRSSGPLSLLVTGFTPWVSAPDATDSTQHARVIFYAVTGTPFNARPAPFKGGRWLHLADFETDRDTGGTEVGGRVRGLDLVASRIDGSVSGDDAVAYLEWVFEFRNTSAQAREARLQLALPPGGVVSRATLWINGEEREAAYGGRGQVREAYEKVVRVERRDPLLVTTKGADRALAQAFPIPPNGGTIMFKIGITAPLEVDGGRARLVLPAIFDRNFNFGDDFKHALWIESKRALTMKGPGVASVDVTPQLHRLRGEITDRDLTLARPMITALRDPVITRTAGQIGDRPPIVQEIALAPAKPADALVIVVDGSVMMRAHVDRLMTALDAIPDGARVGLVVAGDRAVPVPMEPWSGNHKAALRRELAAASFAGGQDNAPALIAAFEALEPFTNAELLWVHGPQPVQFTGTVARLEQAASRLARLPKVTLYSVEPGPNELLPDAPWAWSARTLPRGGAIDGDLSRHFGRVFGNDPAVVITRSPQAAGATDPEGSEHIVRLWARDQVASFDLATQRVEAVALAAKHQLVTPVSGAVVLESARQYAENNLRPVGEATVPTVPEPHEWMLLIVVLASLTWMAGRGAFGRAGSDPWV